MAATQRYLWLTSILLLSSGLWASGCGSATSRQATSNSPPITATPTTATAAKSSSDHRGGTSRSDHQGSGLTGNALVARCVAHAAGQGGCPRHPVRATVDVLAVTTGHRIATVHTDQAGRFEVEVPPGEYELVGRSSEIVLYAPTVTVSVRPHQLHQVQVTFFLRHPLPVTPAAAM